MSARVALLTGGTAGIGLAIAHQLAGEGWSLTITGTRDEGAASTTLREIPGRTIYVKGDVAQASARAAFVESTMDAYGRIDALINNAGITSPGREDFLTASEESFDRVMEVNLKGPYFLAQSVARRLHEQRTQDSSFIGRIVNITSISASVVSVNRGDYCMSKAALSMGTKVMAASLSELGILCYEVRPGLILTDMTSVVKEKYDRLIQQGLTLEGRWGQPEDVGRAVAALLRGDFPYSTGQVVMIDGGLTVQVL
jgi:3-oxoacyl-[acyl-carrier protein] reductase